MEGDGVVVDVGVGDGSGARGSYGATTTLLKNILSLLTCRSSVHASPVVTE